MLIPFAELPPETLTNVIKDWLSRQSQDSSAIELSENERVEQVRDLLVARSLLVSWDDESQTINLVSEDSVLPSDE